MKNPFRSNRVRVATALIAVITIGASPAMFNGEWNKAAAGVAVVTLAAALVAAGFLLGRASAKAEQIYAEELRCGPDHKGLGPKDFAMDLYIQPVTRIDDTDTTGGDQ